MSVWWWVRHAATGSRAFNGWTDVVAEPIGAEAARLAAALPPGAPIVSSDLARARTTAEAIGANRLRWPDEPAFREMHFGAWEGLTFTEVEAVSDPATIRAVLDGADGAAPPEGEDWTALDARVEAAVARLDGRAPAIVAVAHLGPIATQIARATGADARTALATGLPHLSVTRIERGRPARLIEAGRRV